MISALAYHKALSVERRQSVGCQAKQRGLTNRICQAKKCCYGNDSPEMWPGARRSAEFKLVKNYKRQHTHRHHAETDQDSPLKAWSPAPYQIHKGSAEKKRVVNNVQSELGLLSREDIVEVVNSSDNDEDRQYRADPEQHKLKVHSEMLSLQHCCQWFSLVSRRLVIIVVDYKLFWFGLQVCHVVLYSRLQCQFVISVRFMPFQAQTSYDFMRVSK